MTAIIITEPIGDDLQPSPAAGALATPTDLSDQEVNAVVVAVNPLIADAFALYVKTKNFHSK